MSESELRPGDDRVLAHEPGRDVPAPASLVMSLRQISVRIERGVTVTAGLDAEGRFLWLVQASNARSVHQAIVYDRRKVQPFVDAFALSLAAAPSV